MKKLIIAVAGALLLGCPIALADQDSDERNEPSFWMKQSLIGQRHIGRRALEIATRSVSEGFFATRSLADASGLRSFPMWRCPVNSPLKNTILAYFNLGKLGAKLLAARKSTTYVVDLASHPCDAAAS